MLMYIEDVLFYVSSDFQFFELSGLLIKIYIPALNSLHLARVNKLGSKKDFEKDSKKYHKH